MNFTSKSIAIAASLIAATSTSFAVDIDLGTLASASVSLDIPTLLTDVADASLVNGDGANNLINSAIILQDQVDASGFDAVANIDQIGATGSFAFIYQGPIVAGSVAYIQQNATLNTVAVITQR